MWNNDTRHYHVLLNMNSHTKFGENSLVIIQVIILKQKYGYVWGR